MVSREEAARSDTDQRQTGSAVSVRVDCLLEDGGHTKERVGLISDKLTIKSMLPENLNLASRTLMGICRMEEALRWRCLRYGIGADGEVRTETQIGRDLTKKPSPKRKALIWKVDSDEMQAQAHTRHGRRWLILTSTTAFSF